MGSGAVVYCNTEAPGDVVRIVQGRSASKSNRVVVVEGMWDVATVVGEVAVGGVAGGQRSRVEVDVSDEPEDPAARGGDYATQLTVSQCS